MVLSFLVIEIVHSDFSSKQKKGFQSKDENKDPVLVTKSNHKIWKKGILNFFSFNS